MGSRRQQVDGIQIASPCSMEWSQMEGDERVRFCGACRLHVYNLSAMDVEEAAQLISDASTEVCVRLYRRRDGTVLTQDCPVGRRVAVRRKCATFWGTLAASAGAILTARLQLPVHPPPVRAKTKTLQVSPGQIPQSPTLAKVRMGRVASRFMVSRQEDGAVLEAALKDLLADPASPLEPRVAERQQILVSTEASNRVPSSEDILLKYDMEQWKKLSPAQLELAQMAAKDVARRARSKERFQGFAPKDPRIVQFTQADEEKAEREKDPVKRLRRPQVFRAYPPGYSADGTLAVVYLAYPWSGGFHSGVATYVLARRGKAWDVLMHQLILYV